MQAPPLLRYWTASACSFILASWICSYAAASWEYVRATSLLSASLQARACHRCKGWFWHMFSMENSLSHIIIWSTTAKRGTKQPNSPTWSLTMHWLCLYCIDLPYWPVQRPLLWTGLDYLPCQDIYKQNSFLMWVLRMRISQVHNVSQVVTRESWRHFRAQSCQKWKQWLDAWLTQGTKMKRRTHSRRSTGILYFNELLCSWRFWSSLISASL